MSREPPPFLHFSISHQTYTTNFTLDYHSSQILTWWLSTIQENDPRSWGWWHHTRWWSTIHETHTTETIRDHGNDLTTGEKILWEREFIRRHRVLCFIFDRWCIMIYVSLKKFNLGYYVFAGFYDPLKQDIYKIAYSYMFYDSFRQDFYITTHSYMFYVPFRQDFYIIVYAYMV